MFDLDPMSSDCDACYPYLNKNYSLLSLSRNSAGKKAISVLNSLKNVIESPTWNDLRDLIKTILDEAKNFFNDSEEDTVPLCVCLRVIKVAREEALKYQMGENADFEENLTNRLFAVGNEAYETVTRAEILESILNAIEDLSSEIDLCVSSLADLSVDFIHSEELILTVGYSRSVYHFLRHANKYGRSFKVIVCECYPENKGQKLAEELSKAGVSAILVPDSHIFALMSRVNKVIVGCHAVYPDGTVKATVGTYGAILAAKHFSIPVYVCLPHYKLSPIPQNLNRHSTPSFTVQPTADPSNRSLDWLDSSSILLPPNDHILIESDLTYPKPSEGPIVWAPKWEKIPAGLVSLFLTDLGAHAPSYLYALGRELFHTADIKTASSWNH